MPGQELQVAIPDGSGRPLSVKVPSEIQPGSSFTVKYSNIPTHSSSMFPTPAPSPTIYTETPEQEIPVAIPVNMNTNGSQFPYSEHFNQLHPGTASTVSIHDQHQKVSEASAPNKCQYSLTPQPKLNNCQQMMLVQVPPGTAPGSTLHVQPPGESVLIAAVVPPGVKQFHVAYQPTNQANTNQTFPSFENGCAQNAKPSAPSIHYTGQLKQSQIGSALHTHDQHQKVSQASSPMGEKQQVILVHVPPGTASGSTLHVQPPNEPFLISAVVPPGVTQFPVAYQPTNDVISFESPPTSTHFQAHPIAAHNPQYQNQHIFPQAGIQTTPENNQLKLLVKVPPGTAPGSKLHVSVPGENRVIAAVVPPGVSEFQVSYSPRLSNKMQTENQSKTQMMGHNISSSYKQSQATCDQIQGTYNQAQGAYNQSQVAHNQNQNGYYQNQNQNQNGYSQNNSSYQAQGAYNKNQSGQNQNQNSYHQNNSSNGGGFLSNAMPMIAGAGMMAAAGAVGYTMFGGEGGNNENDDGGGYDDGGYDDGGGYDE